VEGGIDEREYEFDAGSFPTPVRRLSLEMEREGFFYGPTCHTDAMGIGIDILESIEAMWIVRGGNSLLWAVRRVVMGTRLMT